MRQFAASLLAGPGREPDPPRRAGHAAWLWCAPLALLCAPIVVCACAGMQAAPAWPGGRALTLAACAAALSLCLAVLPVLAGPGRGWLLPLWLMPSAGILGWPLLPWPAGEASSVARAAALSLPFGVLVWSGRLACVAPGQSRAALACGAGRGTRLRLAVLRLAPAAGWAGLAVFALCLELLA